VHHCSPVSVSIILDVILAFTKGIPKFNRSVPRARNNLPVVSTETDGKYIGGMTDETPRSVPSIKIPKTERVIPRRRQSELAVRGYNNVGNEMVVSMKNSFWKTLRVLIMSQLPDNESLVWGLKIRCSLGIKSDQFTSRSSYNHIWIFGRRRNSSDPSLVPI